ncbi:Translocation protein SEC63-like [Durusdinium trenchii]|uniref:Translocation protein SEC63-like n=1 Tax=Durusdinium trenchii TaxID=1381693 RepID=A0ABP0IX86_9DINO
MRRIRDTERCVEAKLRFQISRPGKHSLTVHALCDSYVGIDKKVDLNFNVSTDEEVKREIFVHPEDEDLDLQPTLFQQFMGELGGEDESEDEEDEKNEAKKSKVEKLSDGKQPKADSDDDKKDGDESDSSDSDSDGDGD